MRSIPLSRRLEVFCLTLILLAAAAFRVWKLNEVPAGLTHDEADLGHFALSVYHGQPIRIAEPYGYAYQPLGHFTVAGLMHLLGPGILPLRLNSAIFGLFMVLFAYLWVRRAYDLPTALLAAGLIAVSYWPVSTSRQGNHFIPVPALATAAACLLWPLLHPAIRHPRSPAAWGIGLLSHRPGFLRPFALRRALRRAGLVASAIGSPPLRPAFAAAQGAHALALSPAELQAGGTESTSNAWRSTAPLVLGAGAALGSTFYAYEAAVPAYLGFFAFAAYLSLFHRRSFERPALASLWLALGIALLIALPHLLDPNSWGRTRTLSEPLRLLQGGEARLLLANALEALGTFTFRGDSLVTYNLPGRPIFDPLVGLFFYVGLALALWECRRPANALALLWFGLGLVPSLIVGAHASTLHSIAAQTPTYLFAALGAVSVWRYFERHASSRARRAWGPAAMIALLAYASALTAYDYFGRWANSGEARAAYFGTLREALDFARSQPESSLAISGPFPNFPHDPFIGELLLRPDQQAARWFDGRSALILPDVEKGLLVIPASAPLDPAIASLTGLTHPRRIALASGIDPYFDVYHWAPRAARAAALRQVSAIPEADFGGVLRLVGYQLFGIQAAARDQPEALRARSYESLELATVWAISDPSALDPNRKNPYGPEARIFVHLLARDGVSVSQQDTLDAPVYTWHPGDFVIQLHHLPLSPELPSGEYRLIAGLYTLPEVTALPVIQSGDPVGKFVILTMVALAH